MTKTILSLDLGTSSTKGLLVDASGGVLGSHQISCQLQAPQQGYAELCPDEIVAAVREVIEAIGGDHDLVLGCAMHSLIAIDANDRPISKVLTWADQRSAGVARELRTGAFAEGLHERTGTPIHPMSPLCKLRHWRQAEPELFARAARFVSIKEYVLHELTGEWCVDESVASATGLFDVEERTWDREALGLAGVEADRLSPLVETTAIVPWGRRRIVVGATDGVLANLGVGGPDGRLPCLTLGTSGAARLTVDYAATDADGRLFCYVLDADLWVVGGAINNGGLVLRWMRQTFGGENTTDDELVRAASEVEPGAEGLVCVPTLTGDRYPSYRTDEAASLTGLRLGHGRAHIARAGLEGMMLAFAPLIRDLEEVGGAGAFDEIRIGGGMFEWEFCRQLLADVVGRRVAMPESKESSALGGARLAFAALGIDFEWPDTTPFVHEPDDSRVEIYQDVLARRRELLDALGP